MDSETILVFLGVVAMFVVGFAYIQVREKINLKKAETGEDKEKLRQLVALALPGETGYRVAYAHWEKVEYRGRTQRTTYFCYALAFDASRLWVIPLRFQGNEAVPAQAVLFTSEMIGMAEVDISKHIESVRRVNVILRDKEGKQFLICNVDAANTREDRFHHFNILQEEECDRFAQFMQSMSNQVKQSNQGLAERLADDEMAQKAKKAKKLGIIGLACFLLPIISVALGVVGLCAAPKPKQTGGKATAALLLPALSLAVGILMIACMIYFM